MPRTLKLTVSYDGTDFAGWQRQASERTVQATLEDALQPIDKRAVIVTGAGRTDRGVHAAAQVASVSVDTDLSCDELRRALNATLPTDVRVLAIADAAADFSARHDARVKTYHYVISNGVAVSPMLRRYAWHVPQPLDVAQMTAAASVLVGEHDFAAFQAAGGDVKTTVRRILSSSVRLLDLSDVVAQADGDRVIRYEVSGTGFLRYMVRNIVGTLVDVGRSRSNVEKVAAILASRDRREASATAPPHGLTLWRVEY